MKYYKIPSDENIIYRVNQEGFTQVETLNLWTMKVLSTTLVTESQLEVILASLQEIREPINWQGK